MKLSDPPIREYVHSEKMRITRPWVRWFQDARDRLVQIFPTSNANSTVWDDVRFPATAINPPGLVSDPGWDSTYVGWLFDASSTEMIHVICQLPHRYLVGSSIRPHVHWQPKSTNTGTVAWKLEYAWDNNGDVQSSFTADTITPAANGTSLKYQINSFTEIDGTGMRESSILAMKLSRVGGSDTYTADALLKEFDIHFQVGKMGTEVEYPS